MRDPVPSFAAAVRDGFVEGVARRPFATPPPTLRSKPVYGYARVSRGRDDGTDTLRNQGMRLTSAGVDVAHIHQDIVTGTISPKGSVFWMQRCHRYHQLYWNWGKWRK